jgi:glycine/D-amino acid oxidase-like deaminating enzyme
MPETCDATLVGLGGMGSSAACHLARPGQREDKVEIMRERL